MKKVKTLTVILEQPVTTEDAREMAHALASHRNVARILIGEQDPDDMAVHTASTALMARIQEVLGLGTG